MSRTKGRNSAGTASGGGAAVSPPQPLTFSIPLKDTPKPVAFPANFKKHIALEFAMRYLCQIGATPTVENCRAVLKEMPLEACSVTAAWRSRGCLADAIIIQPGGHRGGGRAGGGMGEAPPSPSGESPLLDVSPGKSGGGHMSELNDQGGEQGAANSRHSRSSSGGTGKNGNPPPCAHANAKCKTATVTQPASSMGRASPHKVSIFVDAVSSAVGPTIAESPVEPAGRRRAGGLGGEEAAAAALRSSAARNNRGRQIDDSAARRAGTSGRGACLANNDSRERSRTQQKQQMLRDRRPRTGDFGRGEFEDKPALSSRNEGGGDGVSPGGDHNDVDETVLWDEAQLAEARRKMLDPPKVDMASIATIQAAFARNFPFQKHGGKFADVSVRSSLKNLIMSDGPGRLIGLLSHYLYWIMLLPFSLAHKDHDDRLLLEAHHRSSRRKQTARVKLGDNGSRGTRAIASSTTTTTTTTTTELPPSMTKPSTPTSPTTTARRQGAHENGENEQGCGRGEGPRHPPPPIQRGSGGSKTTTMTRSSAQPGDAREERFPRPQLTKDEAESLFVSVVEAWTRLRSSLGASRWARLVQLPIAVATVRNGVQTVLCNCYPFMETKGGGEGKRLLVSLHEEVAARFIPRFYYEGPFTPVAEEEARQSAENQPNFTAVVAASAGAPERPNPPSTAPARVPAAAPGENQETGTSGGKLSSPLSSQPPVSSPPVKKSKNFLETSATLREARRRRARAGSWSARAAAPDDRPSTTSAAVELRAAGENPHVVGGSRAKRFARDRPGGTRRTGEALFATSTTLGYVFPNPCSPEARKMIASRARARSSQDASRTTLSPSPGVSLGLGVTKSPPRAPSKPARKERAAAGHTSSPPSRGASTPGRRSRPVWAFSGERGDAEAQSPPFYAARRHAAGTGNATSKKSRCKREVSDKTSGRCVDGGPDFANTASVRLSPQEEQHPNEEQLTCRINSSRDGPAFDGAAPSTGPPNAGKCARFRDQSLSGPEKVSAGVYDGVEGGEPEGRVMEGDIGNPVDTGGSSSRRCTGGMDVRISVGVGGGGIGSAAKAKLYRGFCEQRGEDYDREYRRHGGKEALERLALLNGTLR